MSKVGWIHGSTVDPETREVRYLSPSSLKLADMSTEKGCLRKWFYAYVRGLKEPTTWQQQAGTNDHACAEKYLETGERVFSPRVAKGIHMLPPPGPHLIIEQDMTPFTWECKGKHDPGKHTNTCKKKSGLADSLLRAAGIPVTGRIDLMHDLCMNYGADNPDAIHDPPNTVEVFDHKFTKDLRYALKGTDMVKDIQMVAYGEYVFRSIPTVERVRLSHGYYPTNGNAVKRTILTTREPIARFWSEHVEPLARSIAHAAKETNPDKVPANLKACKSFGRMCMHAEYCSAAMDAGVGQNLSSQLGGTGAQALLQIIKKPKDSNVMPLLPGKGLLAHIKQPTNDAAAREAELAKLKAEEEAAAKKIVPANFAAILAGIEAHGKGMPQLGSDAAKAYAFHHGYEWKVGTGYGGSGELAQIPQLTHPDQFEDLLKELNEAFGEKPIMKAKDLTNVEQVPVASAGILAPDAPEIDTEVVTQTVTSIPSESAAEIQAHAEATETVTADVEKPKARKPRTPKAAVIKTNEPATEGPKEALADKVLATEGVPVIRDEDPTADAQYVKQIASQPTPAPALDERINLIVDTVIDGKHDYIDLGMLVDTLSEAIAQRFDLPDLRAGGDKHPLAYGKWKPVVQAALRESGQIGPGTYYIDARGNEVYEEAVQAIRAMVKRTGGVYVRGLR